MMLSKKRCPHTGVVNFFVDADPYLPVGSAVKVGRTAGYHWRYYSDRAAAGAAPNLKAAEQHVAVLYREAAERSTRKAGMCLVA